MEFFCGLDVAMDETAICVVDDDGKTRLQVTAVTEAIRTALKPFLARLRRVGHEAGALSPWLHPELLKLGLPAIYLETQHVRRRWGRSATKPTQRMRLALLTSSAPAGSEKRISRPNPAIACVCC